MKSQNSLIFGSLCSLFLALPISAQITPDNTLGNENTTLTPINPNTYHIDGGAIRDINLFHSFLEFNIQQNQNIYFSNPLGVENILTRVTGNNFSHINGRLGVSGEANLFLLNPNGIIFGENASLDIRGSFLATTADRIQLGDNGFFSATDIANSQLLAIQPGALFHNALNNHQARIENQGNLQVGGNLTLDSDILTLQGQLHAGGDLLLNAKDTVTLRDSSTTPFIATAKGEMLIQGNNSVDIFILNHSDSGLYSRGNMTLRSANPVIGDAHYQTGGNFRVETLDGSLGRFYSPDDPVIFADGDFSILDYYGASLHVLAGGSINIPDGITIDGPDTIGESINPGNLAFYATVTTSDGQTTTIDGSAEPTIDLRAGIDWAQIGGPPGNFIIGAGLSFTGFFDGFTLISPDPTSYSPTATSADINVGALTLFDPGQVLLTNQYIPNTALNGNITVTDIFNDGGNVILDSKGNINVGGLISVDGVLPADDAGNVKLLAANDITFSGGFNGIFASGQRSGSITLDSQGNTVLNDSFIVAESNAPTAASVGNDINISAQNLTINNAFLSHTSAGLGSLGNFNINVRDTATFDNSFVFNEISAGAEGTAGDVNITARSLSAINGTQISNNIAGRGQAGNVNINVRDVANFDSGNALSFVNTGAVGNGGNVNVTAGRLTASNNSLLSASVFGQGNAGNVNINVRNIANFDSSFASSEVDAGAIGNSGEVKLAVGSLTVSNNSQLSSSTLGQGNGGNVEINVRDAAEFNNSIVSSEIDAGAIGNGGEVKLSVGSLTVSNNSQLSSRTFGQGNAGNVKINVRDAAILNNGFVSSGVFSGAIGNGGEVKLTAGSLTAINNSEVESGTSSQGNAGNIEINVGDRVVLDNSLVSSEVLPGAIGNSGEVKLSAQSLTVSNGSQLSSSTSGQGNAGNIEINVGDRIVLDNSVMSSEVDTSGVGNGGQFNLAANALIFRNQSDVSTTTFGRGDAGNLNINVQDRAVFDDSFVGSSVDIGAVGNSGQVNLASGSLALTNGGILSAGTAGQGNAGSLNVNVRNGVLIEGITSRGVNGRSLRANGSRITTEVGTSGVGNSGELTLNAGSLSVTNSGLIFAATAGRGNAGNMNINVRDEAVFEGNQSGAFSNVGANAIGNGGRVTVNSGALRLREGATVSSSAAGVGVAGDIAVNTGVLSLESSRILTETRSGDGGNIGLNVDGILVLRNGSLISTTAGSAGVGGNGGNINIRAEFVLGVPGENSDITANAFEGQGGNILITTNGIYGLRFRDSLTPLSDITASSEFGLNGTFTLDLLSFPAEQGINELPGALVDAEALVGRDVCAVENDQIAGGSSFVVTGKGGLPPNPVELMTPGTPSVEWATRSENNAAVAIVPRTEPLERSQFQQTQGWVVTPSGQIELTAVAPNAEMGAQGYAFPICGEGFSVNSHQSSVISD